MKHLIKILLCLFTLTMPCMAYADKTAETFFAKYILLSHSFDPAIVDLYADNARIQTLRIYPDGSQRRLGLSGTQWKELIRVSIDEAKKLNDKDTFSDIVITQHENKYKIAAKRYSTKKCYTDDAYFMVIAPNSTGGFHIIGEYSETRALPDC